MSKVIIEKRNVYQYPSKVPFRPGQKYPEYPFEETVSESNEVYDMVRNSFRLLEYDLENFGKKGWNPLGRLISPGDTVLIKPNMVMDVNGSGEGEDCLYTNPAVVAAVLDYAYIALQGEGSILVGDAPMQECCFEKLINESGYAALIEWCRDKYGGIDIQLIDFRELKSAVVNGIHKYDFSPVSMGKVIDLAEQSEFAGMGRYKEKHIRITNYDPDILRRHHNSQKHEYYVSGYVLQADVIINMPKPKTHRKAGVTIALKNLVGINARKEYLPHHTNGSIKEGGDEYLNKSFFKKIMNKCLDYRNREAMKNRAHAALAWDFLRKMNAVLAKYTAKDWHLEGSWYGNNTISKTILDLNKILFYADKQGIMQDKKQRKYLIVADMIISGEREGPVMPSPKDVGIIAAGENPVDFDRVIARLMGADISKIPTLNQFADYKSKYDIMDGEETIILSNEDILNQRTEEEFPEEAIMYFVPTSGWKGVFRIKSGEK